MRTTGEEDDAMTAQPRPDNAHPVPIAFGSNEKNELISDGVIDLLAEGYVEMADEDRRLAEEGMAAGFETLPEE